MDTYSLLREIADSWVLLAMFGFFAAVVAFAFRPGSTKTYDDVSQIPLRNDTPAKTCTGPCDTCACSDADDFLKGAHHG